MVITGFFTLNDPVSLCIFIARYCLSLHQAVKEHNSVPLLEANPYSFNVILFYRLILQHSVNCACRIQNGKAKITKFDRGMLYFIIGFDFIILFQIFIDSK